MRKVSIVIFYILFGVLAVGLFFRDTIRSDWDILPGHRGDGRLNIVLMEHWYRVINGQEEWRSPNYFYPLKGAMGFSDALFLNALPYSFFRSIGIDSFLSSTFTLLIISAMGYLGMSLLLRLFFGAPHVVCITGSVIFIVINQAYISTGSSHPQLLTFWLLPLMCIPLFSYLKNPNRLKIKGWFTGMCFCVSLPLLCFSCFYMGWFSIFYGCVVGVLSCVVLFFDIGNRFSFYQYGITWHVKIDGKKLIERSKNLDSAYYSQFAVFGLAGFIALLPFLYTYLPVKGDGREFSEIIIMAPEVFDFVNVGYHNMLWGSILESILPNLNDRPYFWELWFGFSPVLLATFTVTVILSFIENKRDRYSGNYLFEKDQMIMILGLGVLICWLFLLRKGPFSLWWLVYKIVPGGDVVRAVSRFNLFLAFPVIIVSMMGIGAFWNKFRKISNPALRNISLSVLAMLSLFLCIEQLNHMPFGNLSRKKEISILNRFSKPPQGIKAFYFTEPVYESDSWEYQHVDAMMLAQKLDVPTVHGYSGKWPKTWRLNKNIADKEYPQAVHNWLLSNAVYEGVYRLSGKTGKWGKKIVSIQELAASYMLGHEIIFRNGGNASKYLIDGWSIPEDWGVWTDGPKSRMVMKLTELPEKDILLSAQVIPYINKKHPEQRVFIAVNGEPVGNWFFTLEKPNPEPEMILPVSIVISRVPLTIVFELPDAQSPKRHSLSEDSRRLGLGFKSLTLTIHETQKDGKMENVKRVSF